MMQTFTTFINRIIIVKATLYIVVLLLIITFVAEGYLQTTNYNYQVPLKYNDGWAVASLESQGIDIGPIEEVSRQG
jgi:hypothetical protein